MFNKIIVKIIVVILILCNVILFSCKKKPQIIADKLIIGNIVTMDDKNPVAEMVGIKNGKIIFVGSRFEAQDYTDFDTKAIDFNGMTIYPGFINSHSHGALYGWESLGQLSLSHGKSYDDYVNIFKQYLLDNSDRDYYIANDFKIIGDRPTHEFLDNVSTDIPLMARSGEGDFIILNKPAMELCKITKETVTKYLPGEVDTFEDGEPTGLIYRSAMYEVVKSLSFSTNDLKENILEWQKLAFSKGYTSAIETSSNLFSTSLETAYTELSKNGELKLRTFSFIPFDEGNDTKEYINKTSYFKKSSNSEFYKLLGYKIFLEMSFEAETCYLMNEYECFPHSDKKRFIYYDKLVSLIKTASEYDMSVHAASLSDQATVFFLNSINDAKNQLDGTNQRNMIINSRFLDLPNNKTLNLINIHGIPLISFTPITKDMYKADNNENGEGKVVSIINTNSCRSKGNITAFFHEYPIRPIFSVPMNIYYLSHIDDLSTNDYSDLELLAKQNDAILSYTRSSAYAIHEENNIGTIEVGKCADFTVFKFDFFHNPLPYEYAQVLEPVATVINGEIVYQK